MSVQVPLCPHCGTKLQIFCSQGFVDVYETEYVDGRFMLIQTDEWINDPRETGKTHYFCWHCHREVTDWVNDNFSDEDWAVM